MQPSSWQTIRCPVGRDPAPVAHAWYGTPTRVRLRSLALVNSFGFAVEDMELFSTRTSPLTEADIFGRPNTFTLPPGEVFEADLSPEQYVVAASPDDVSPLVSIHRSAYIGLPPAGGVPTGMRTLRALPIDPRRRPNPIARAARAPVRVTVRNLGTGFGLGTPSIAVGSEEMDLTETGILFSTGYQLRANLAGTVRDTFVLAPGQVLYAVALGAVPVPISILTHEAFVV